LNQIAQERLILLNGLQDFIVGDGDRFGKFEGHGMVDAGRTRCRQLADNFAGLADIENSVTVPIFTTPLRIKKNESSLRPIS